MTVQVGNRPIFTYATECQVLKRERRFMCQIGASVNRRAILCVKRTQNSFSSLWTRLEAKFSGNEKMEEKRG